LGADPLREGQVTVEATYALVVHLASDDVFQHITHNQK